MCFSPDGILLSAEDKINSGKTYLIGLNVKQDGISWAGCGLLSAQLCLCGRALQQVVGLLGTRWAP